MTPPRKAVVLAAGYGTRLHPFTLDCPKALVPLNGKPMLAHTLERLAAWGVDDVAVNVHTLADQIVNVLPEITPSGMKTVISFEPEILGTGGGLVRLAWFLGQDPFWICNADVVADLDPTVLIDTFASRQPMACLWMVPDKGPQTVEVGKNNLITSFRGQGHTFSGLHLVSPRLLNFLPKKEQFGSIITAYEQALSEGEDVLGIEVPGSDWADVGTPEELLRANGTSVIFPGAEVGPGIRLKDAVVGPGAVLKGRRAVSGNIMSPRHGLDPEERKWFPKVGSVERLSFRGSDRSYRRLHFTHESLILSVSGNQRPENKRVVSHTRFLDRQGVRVPEVKWTKQKGRVLVLEDIGQVHLLDRLTSGSDRRNRQDMRKVLHLAARLHSLPPPKDLEPPFTAELVKWEHTLFREEFLNRFDPQADHEAILNALENVGQRCLSQPVRLIHRDLQSTNIMWKEGEPVLIDFQGMRRGPVAYDLGSLLADPYMHRSVEEQKELLEIYNAMTKEPVSLKELATGAVQRLCQALGAYGRLGSKTETQRFLDYIPAAIEQLSYWAEDSVLKGWASDFSGRQVDLYALGQRCE